MILPIEYTGFDKDDQPLNAMQVLVEPYKDELLNIVLEAQTGAGKTTIIHMCGYKYLFAQERKKILYVAPMKALVEEKKATWTHPKHPWSFFNFQIITGDYVNSWEDAQTLRDADIIVITPESLASRLRNSSSDKSGFLNNIGMLVVDEAHLLGEPGRGGILEAVLLEFTTEHPDTQLLMLSGTLKNAEQITDWVGSLNNLPTVHIKSEWRATELIKHFYPYSSYDKGDQRIVMIDRIIDKNPDAQMLIGVFLKSFGRKIEDHLKKRGKEAEFHSADSNKYDRESIEKRFRSGVTQYVPCTSTLFVGMNLPGDHVIITAATNGGGDVPAATLNQAAGRAGRIEFSNEGHAHFLLPDSNFEYHKQRIIEGEPVLSQLQTVNDIAIHFLGAVYIGRIRTEKDFNQWFKRTLRYRQYPMKDEQVRILLTNIVNDMEKRGMAEENTGRLVLKPRGEVVAQMAIDPYYLFDLICNFSKVLAMPKPKTIHWAWALGATTEFYMPMSMYGYAAEQIPREVKDIADNAFWKGVTAHYALMTGADYPSDLNSMVYKVKTDMDRIGIILSRLNNQIEMWKDSRVEILPYRVTSGATEDEANFMARSLTFADARKLTKAGITNLKEMRSNWDTVKGLFSSKKLEKLALL